MQVRAPLLVLVLLLAGCLGGTPDTGPPVAAPSLPTFDPPVALDAYGGAEPVIAAASDGTLYIEGVGLGQNKVSRSTDGGTTWIDITPPFEGQERTNDGFVAVGPDDAVYAANVFSLTFQVFRSDDRGDTWTKLALPPLPALMHRHWIVFDDSGRMHVTIEALPPSFLPWLVGGPTPTDPALFFNEGLWYLTSADRGTTWSVPRQIDPQVNFAGQGMFVVAPDGHALYYPRYEEAQHAFGQTYQAGHWYLIASDDGGTTWERREMFDLTSELASAVMPLVLDANGTLHFAWTQEAGGTSVNFHAFSADGGRTWSAPRALTPEPGTQAMPWLAARADGTLGVLYYHSGVHGTAGAVDAPWYVHYAQVHGAATAAPRTTFANLTTDPVHHGNVCAKGPACEGQEDRSLLDYLWLVYGADGAAEGVYASTEWDRGSAFAVYVGEHRTTR